jgi:hypothetical protein
MAEIFCNIDNSGVTNGTSFATGFTDIRDAWNGATYGDAIYINAGSTAYVLSGANVYASNDALSIYATNPTVHIPTNIIGIKDGNTASVPMGDERPLITCNRTNGASVFFPRGSNVENLRVDGDMLTSGNSSLVAAYFCTMRKQRTEAMVRFLVTVSSVWGLVVLDCLGAVLFQIYQRTLGEQEQLASQMLIIYMRVIVRIVFLIIEVLLKLEHSLQQELHMVLRVSTEIVYSMEVVMRHCMNLLVLLTHNQCRLCKFLIVFFIIVVQQ